MNERGWHIETQHLPPNLHMIVSPVHIEKTNRFLTDLRDAVPKFLHLMRMCCRSRPPFYAMIGTLPDRKMASEMVLQYLNDLYSLK